MADTKISALTAASALTGTEEFAVNQSGVSKKATAAQIAASGPAWTAYTPTFTAATTNPTVGNFTRSGRYVQIGKTVHFHISLICNSATGIGSGTYTLGVPVASRSASEPAVIVGYQIGPAKMYNGYISTTTTFVMRLTSDFSAFSNTTSGMISGTEVHISGTYEAA